MKKTLLLPLPRSLPRNDLASDSVFTTNPCKHQSLSTAARPPLATDFTHHQPVKRSGPQSQAHSGTILEGISVKPRPGLRLGEDMGALEPPGGRRRKLVACLITWLLEGEMPTCQPPQMAKVKCGDQWRPFSFPRGVYPAGGDGLPFSTASSLDLVGFWTAWSRSQAR